MDGVMTTLLDHPSYSDNTDHVEEMIKVRTSHDGQYDVPVYVHTPNSLVGEKNRPVVIYAHGGGGIGCSAAIYRPLLRKIAVHCGVVVFNVDYRLAPETKCPNNVKDFYSVVKHVADNADRLGVDPARIAIAGESGGGYICLGAMVMLAQKDEGGLVKLAMPCVPMTDDYSFSDPAAMTKEEREGAFMQRKLWKLIATDLEAQHNDPLLWPGKASDELLEKMPPTVMFEDEFDFYITEAQRFSRRLRAAGRLLEYVEFPGCTHAMHLFPTAEKEFKIGMDAYKKTVKEYLIN